MLSLWNCYKVCHYVVNTDNNVPGYMLCIFNVKHKNFILTGNYVSLLKSITFLLLIIEKKGIIVKQMNEYNGFYFTVVFLCIFNKRIVSVYPGSYFKDIFPKLSIQLLGIHLCIVLRDPKLLFELGSSLGVNLVTKLQTYQWITWP